MYRGTKCGMCNSREDPGWILPVSKRSSYGPVDRSMLGARLAVPSSSTDPYPTPVPNARHAAMQRWFPCSRYQRKGQPSPSPARAQHSIIIFVTGTGSWRNRPASALLQLREELLVEMPEGFPLASLLSRSCVLTASSPPSPFFHYYPVILEPSPPPFNVFHFPPLSRLILLVHKAAHCALHRGPRHAPSFLCISAKARIAQPSTAVGRHHSIQKGTDIRYHCTQDTHQI